jgi:hypothetical protein
MKAGKRMEARIRMQGSRMKAGTRIETRTKI